MAITRQIAVISDSDSLSENDQALINGGRSLATDSGYQEALEYMQEGQWEQVLPMLRLLKAQYPDATELDTLMQEAALRSDFEESWGDKVKGRRSGVSVGRVMSRVVPIVLIAILLVSGGLYFYRLRALNAVANAQQALLSQAQSALQAGLYNDAIGFFEQILSDDQENAAAAKGKEEAEKQLALQEDYNLGVDAMAAGDVAAALQYFTSLEEKAPGYRDVAQRINEVESAFKTEQVFSEAGTAYESEDWAVAIQKYEALRLQDSTYETAVVTDNLVDSYLRAGQDILDQSPADGANPELAEQYFQKVLKLKTGEPTARSETKLLDTYFSGERSFRLADYAEAADRLQVVYDQRPRYLGGYMAEYLYQAYIELGDRAMQQSDNKTALEMYNRATELHVSDASAALTGSYRAAVALTPTPTPTYTPTPTLTPEPTATLAPPAPTATPVPLPIEAYKGWILFRSDREGGNGYYLMQPDGSQVRPAPPDAGEKIDLMYRQAAWSPDGNTQVIVKKLRRDSEDVDMYRIRHDLPENWRRVFEMSTQPGSQYDPVWDPTNHGVVYVSNHTGNDELWFMNTEGENKTQLTFNTWQWDKHPSWSLDGGQIAFFSNRTGPKQIWIMNRDGSGQVNISNNEFNDWDPTFITGKPVPLPEKK